MISFEGPAPGSRFDFCPWLFWSEAGPDEQQHQLAWQEALRADGLHTVGARTYLSPLAAVHATELRVGADSYIAAHVYLTGEVTLGDHTTLNPYATVRGTVRLGTGVRVGAYASLLGFNHSMDPSAPVYTQPLTSRGITVEDDVWIGSHVIVLDGVTVGAHSVLGAGAVVTRDVPPWSVMAGNPARRLRDRREPAVPRAGSTVAADTDLERFGAGVRDQAADLLDGYWVPAQRRFADQPEGPLTVRATCDAVEIAASVLSGPPPSAPAEELLDWLSGVQDERTGLVPEFPADGRPYREPSLDRSSERYHILAVGYALELLGGRWRHPLRAVAEVDADRLVSALDALPWTSDAWHCGDWVDAYATGVFFNRDLFHLPGPVEALFGWLHLHQDPYSGMWGLPTPREGRRQPVNGYYRLTRGSFAQFGVAVPNPESTIDSVLAHSRDNRFFGSGGVTACDVLDVIHPLWLCGQQTDYRRDEARAWARQRLHSTLSHWRPAAGFAFDLGPGASAEHRPSLRGTEMWLSIIWLLADIAGESGRLGYRPRGVHRTEAPGAPLTAGWRRSR